MTRPRVLIPFRYEKKVLPYAEASYAGGLEPLTISVANAPTLNGLDALLLTGGTDVNPHRYGESPHAETNTPDDERDQVELKLISQALNLDVPILAICRGLQLLNVACGGTLHQHLGSPRHDPDPEPESKSDPVHNVEIESGTTLAEFIGERVCPVNSRHHQAVKHIGKQLRVSAAAAEDGIVESLEMPHKQFVLAVQWHPEDMVGNFPEQLKLFERLAYQANLRLNAGVVTK
jgi:putative glutamine amidotransferase